MEGKGQRMERDLIGGRLLMLCQYCSTVMPMDGIRIEREGSQNPKGGKSPAGES